jgi:hypothetical protein
MAERNGRPVRVVDLPRPSRWTVLRRKIARRYVCPLLGHKRCALGNELLWCPRCNLVWETGVR